MAAKKMVPYKNATSCQKNCSHGILKFFPLQSDRAITFLCVIVEV